MGKKRLEYDDDVLVEMIAEGQLTYRAIGEQLGLSESLVKKIARGRKRKDLAARLWDAENGILTEARRIGSRYARNLIMEQVRLGLTGEGEPARRAREFLLKFTASSRPRRKDLPEERQRRPEWVLQDCRDIGITPWEDELDAERMEEEAGEKATGNGQQAAGDGNGWSEAQRPPVVLSMAAGSRPRGPEVPARCPEGVPEVSARCP